MKKVYKLVAFDPETAFTSRTTEFIKRVTSGERTDYMWATVLPPFEKTVFGTDDAVEIVLLATRHEGDSLQSVNGPIHVYVCVPKSPQALFADRVEPEDLSILNWALVLPMEPTSENERSEK